MNSLEAEVTALKDEAACRRENCLLAARFHLDDWQLGIQRSLDVIEAAYRVLADQAAAWRAELLELMIVLLILVEIMLTLTGF